jgi:methylenetetrahydrofolate reductase (NADPH)
MTIPRRGPEGALSRALAEHRFVLTAEISPPVGTDLAGFLERAHALGGSVSAINVTDGAGARAHLSSLVAAAALVRAGLEPILQITCRDRNRLALQADLLGAAACGIGSVLVLGGDPPTAGDQPQARPVHDLSSTEFLAMADAMRRSGQLPPGTPIEGGFAMQLGAADLPVDPAPGWTPKGLAAKLAAGADFVQTQFCMDLGVVRRYAARLLELGIAQRLPILVGVCPIPSARSARWMTEKLHGTIIAPSIVERLEAAADPRAEGVALCAEFLQALVAVPGIAGAHLMAPLNPEAVPQAIAQSGVLGRSRAKL